MGRNMKVVAATKKHLTKEEKEKRKEIEEKASDGLAMLQATPPDYLNATAKREYRRIIKDLRNLPIRNLDRAMLENYCTWNAVYLEVVGKIDKHGYVIFEEEKVWISNPLILTLEKATGNRRSSA